MPGCGRFRFRFRFRLGLVEQPVRPGQLGLGLGWASPAGVFVACRGLAVVAGPPGGGRPRDDTGRSARQLVEGRTECRTAVAGQHVVGDDQPRRPPGGRQAGGELRGHHRGEAPAVLRRALDGADRGQRGEVEQDEPSPPAPPGHADGDQDARRGLARRRAGSGQQLGASRRPAAGPRRAPRRPQALPAVPAGRVIVAPRRARSGPGGPHHRADTHPRRADGQQIRPAGRADAGHRGKGARPQRRHAGVEQHGRREPYPQPVARRPPRHGREVEHGPAQRAGEPAGGPLPANRPGEPLGAGQRQHDHHRDGQADEDSVPVGGEQPGGAEQRRAGGHGRHRRPGEHSRHRLGGRGNARVVVEAALSAVAHDGPPPLGGVTTRCIHADDTEPIRLPRPRRKALG